MYSSCEKAAIFFQEVLDEAPKKPTQTCPRITPNKVSLSRMPCTAYIPMEHTPAAKA